MSSARMGRQARKDQTRQLLIDAAASVFAQRGFDAASLDQVAEAAGFTKGAVYSNFRSKTDLFMGVVERRLEEQISAITRAAANATLAEAIRRLEFASESGGQANFDWLRLVAEFWQFAMRDERARAAMAQQYERARMASARILAEKYAEAGVQPPMPVRDLAILVEAIGIGIGFQAALDPAAVPSTLQGEATRRLLAPSPDPGAEGGAGSGADAGAGGTSSPARRSPQPAGDAGA
ncbi:MAG: TetR/AcrR family transcriptional regulator [Candidatus Limnocylindrales bacterium]